MHDRRRHLHWFTSLLIALSLAGAPQVLAQTPAPVTAKYFPETGHNVIEPFVSYFLANGGVERFGYPITDQYPDAQTGLLVQYFQKARLEWHPGNPDPYKIQLGLLGDLLNKRQAPLAVREIPAASDPSCAYFPETGHAACFQFLDYWKNNGGLDMFGYPISRPALEGGRIVQYFQRARMEWHPERPERQRVQLAALGQIYYDFAELDRGRLPPNLPAISALEKPRTVALRARSSVDDPIVGHGNAQTAHVVVLNQFGAPVSGAVVTLVVHFPSGDQSFTLPLTDATGAASLTFPAGKFKPGTVISMEFIVSTIDGLLTTTRTSYLVWYY